METIRRIEEDDFEAVSALYNGRKSVEELKWLFTNPNDPNTHNAFVAIKNDDHIIGVIGYILSVYSQNNRQILGSIPISWKLTPNYKGMAGVLLFKKVMNLGSFGITIAGSETAKDLYNLFKYKKNSNLNHFYKILNLNNTFKSLHRKSLIKTIGMFGYLLPGFFINPKKSSLDQKIQLIKYDSSKFIEEPKFNTIFRKEINKNYIDWLLDCPLLKTYAFSIKKGSKFLGTCIFYIKDEEGFKKGRIVHLPYLGKDIKIWKSVISKCISFFKKEKCCIIDSVAHNHINQESYLKSGFIPIKKHSKPLYIKDPKSVLKNIEIKNWFLQYSEGDKAYRSF